MTLIFDTETDDLLNKATKLHTICIKHLETGVLHRFSNERVAEGLEMLCQAKTLVGHNILNFDIPVLKKLYPHLSKRLAACDVRDTMLITRLVFPDIKEHDWRIAATKSSDALPVRLVGSHSLEAWGIRLGMLKGAFSKKGDFSCWSQEMEDYCAQDVAITAKLWEKIQLKNPSPQSIELEQRFAAHIEAMSLRGFSFNSAKAGKLYGQLQAKLVEVQGSLASIFPPRIIQMKQTDWLTSDGKQWATKQAAKEAGYKDAQVVRGLPKTKSRRFNPASRDEIAERLIEKYNWKPTIFTETNKPKVDETVLASLPYPEAPILNEYLLLEKRLAQIADGREGWLKAVGADGRMHGRVITNGCVTGRCSHLKPNMGQIPNHGSPYGKECRELFEASNGYELVGADASGLELRCLAHFMAKYDGGAYAKELLTGDIHTANQKAAGLPTRNNAKTFIYAFLYGAGDEKIGKVIGKGAKEGAEIKATFLRKTPALRCLRDAVKAAAKERGYLFGLDGRRLPIRSEHAALNTLLQSAGAIAVKQATILLMDRIKAEGLDAHLVAHVHDEVQLEVRKGLGERVGKMAVQAIQDAGKHFNFRCPLDGEYRVGGNWSETH